MARVYDEAGGREGWRGGARGCYAAHAGGTGRRVRRQAQQQGACERPVSSSTSSGAVTSSVAAVAIATGGASAACSVGSPARTHAHTQQAATSRLQREAMEAHAASEGLPKCFVDQYVAEVGDAADLHAFKASVARREASLRAAFSQAAAGEDTITYERLCSAAPKLCVLAPAGGCSCTRVRFRPEEVQRMLSVIDAGAAGKRRGIAYDEFRAFFTRMPPGARVWDYWANSGEACMLECGCNVNVQARASREGGNPVRHLIAGAAAGAASRTVTAPLETVRLLAVAGSAGGSGTGGAAQKVVAAGTPGGAPTTTTAAAALQAPARAPPSLAASVRNIARRDGVKALWRGNTAMVLRSAPQKGVDFFAYDFYKRLLTSVQARLAGRQDGSGSGGGASKQTQGALAIRLGAGAMAGATSTCLLYPLDVVRTRLAVGRVPGMGAGAPAGVAAVLGAARAVAVAEGPRALYRGLGFAVAAVIPEAAITYGCFDLLNGIVARAYDTRVGGSAPPILSVGCGVVAALIGQTVAYPLEVITRRVSLGKGVASAASGRGTSVVAQLLAVARTEGVGALYAGIPAATVRVLPMAMVSFGTYEAVKRALEPSLPEPSVLQLAAETPCARAAAAASAASGSVGCYTDFVLE